MPDSQNKFDMFNGGQRRGFFSQLLGEALSPLSNIVERQVQPILDMLEQPIGEPEMPAYDAGDMAGPPERYLRPPGALAEADFAQACTRCNKCVEACPAQCIRLDIAGVDAEGLPYIVPREMPCVVCDTLACMPACPTGALKLVPREHVKMGLAKVDTQLCRRHEGEDCQLCVQACPIGETAITISAATGKLRVRRQGCIGCGVCEQACPVEPAAIQIHPLASGHDILIS